jgi:hypothetical protein
LVSNLNQPFQQHLDDFVELSSLNMDQDRLSLFVDELGNYCAINLFKEIMEYDKYYIDLPDFEDSY